MKAHIHSYSVAALLHYAFRAFVNDEHIHIYLSIYTYIHTRARENQSLLPPQSPSPRERGQQLEKVERRSFPIAGAGLQLWAYESGHSTAPCAHEYSGDCDTHDLLLSCAIGRQFTSSGGDHHSETERN